MSIYCKDTLDNIKESISSILTQSYTKIMLLVQVDGFVENEVNVYLNHLSTRDPRVKVFFNDNNQGLAYRMNQLIDILVVCPDVKYVARMDADDISINTRLEKQVNFLDINFDVDVLGSDVIEINAKGQPVFYKRMSSEHSEIQKNIIKKCPFNHPTVMFRKEVFMGGIRYNNKLMNTQDYYLWVDLLAAGMKFANINEPLLYFRVDESFHSRRGWKKAINDLNSRLYAFKNLDVINFGNIVHTVCLVTLRLSPSFLKKLVYKYCR
ncbi:glycosyltransferase [Aeromonas veronii]|uniref:glycosyltransferase n=1 Tax=Aeromonas veronii TaxID=654 RepID=UPI001F371B29|nr:glycosyltransferase [Aeromonas veronii]